MCVHVMKLAPGAPLGGGWGWCLLLQHIGVTRQAFQYDPRAQLSPASQPAVAVTQPLHSRHISLLVTRRMRLKLLIFIRSGRSGAAPRPGGGPK